MINSMRRKWKVFQLNSSKRKHKLTEGCNQTISYERIEKQTKLRIINFNVNKVKEKSINS